jgi:capsid protein
MTGAQLQSRMSFGERMKAAAGGVAALTCGERQSALRCFSSAITGYIEGHEQSRFRRRSGTRLESQDDRLNLGVRDALVSEAIRLNDTVSIFGAINEKYSQHVTGDCLMSWDTGDEKVDEIYEANWQSAMNTLDANGRLHFTQMTDLVAKATLVTGDIFGQMVGRNDANGTPLDGGQIRLIESDRVRNNASFADYDFDKFQIGGIRIAQNGQRQSYRIWDRGQWGLFENPREVSASEIIHVYNPERVDGERGVTAYKRVLNSITDLKETILSEVLSAKNNSKIALLAKTIQGGANTAIPGIWTGGAAGTDTQADGSTITTNAVNEIMTAYMFPGEDLVAFQSSRPADGWFRLMEWLMQDIATGLYLPASVVWKMAGSSTGPAQRFEIAAANRTFQKFRRQVIELMWLRRVVGWRTARDIARGVIPFHPNWANYSAIRPAAITIDVGRDIKSGLDEIDAGLGPMDAYASEGGYRMPHIIRTNIKWVKMMKVMAEKAGLTLSDIRRPATPTATVKQAEISAEAQTERAEQETEKPEKKAA